MNKCQADLKNIVSVEWLDDEHDCDQCGGNWAQGARITINGEETLLEPVAHCFNGDSWNEEEVFKIILNKIGYQYHTKYGG